MSEKPKPVLLEAREVFAALQWYIVTRLGFDGWDYEAIYTPRGIIVRVPDEENKK